MTTRTDNPKVFISYSWSSPQHEEFVLNLATKLMTDGVDVQLDKWDLKEGHDKYHFMEQMVADDNISKVLIICDAKYQEKANSKIGGVGTESQIISSEVYAKAKQEKFIPIIAELDSSGNPCVPIFLKSRIFIDLSSDEKFGDEYDKLLRSIYNRPLNNKPLLGKVPSYLFNEEQIPISTLSIFYRLKHAIEGEKKCKSLSDEFLEQFITSLEDIRITSTSDDIDDEVIKSIDQFRPYRDQFVEYVILLLDYDLFSSFKKDIFNFLEKLLVFHYPPEGMNSYREAWFDNYRFIAMEIFIYLIAVLIKYEKYDELDYFLNEKYLINSNHHQNSASYLEFKKPIRILDEYRNQRLKLNRLSVVADLLRDRANIKKISFQDFIQAEFIMTVRSLLELEQSSYWYPVSIIYKNDNKPFEIFQRAENSKHFEPIKRLLKVISKQELVNKFEQAEQLHGLNQWLTNYRIIQFKTYLNLDNLYQENIQIKK